MKKLLFLAIALLPSTNIMAQKLAKENVRFVFDDPSAGSEATFGTMSIVLSGAESPTVYMLEDYPQIRIPADNERAFRIYQLAQDGNKRGLQVATYSYPVIDQEYDFMFLPAIALKSTPTDDGKYELPLWELAPGNYAIVFPATLTRTAIVHTFTLK